MIFVRADLEKLVDSERVSASFEDFTDYNDPAFSVRQGRLLEGKELWVYDEETGAVGRGILEVLDWQCKAACILVCVQTVIIDLRYSVHYDYSNDAYGLNQD